MKKQDLATLSRKVSSLQRTIRTQKRTIDNLVKAESRQSFQTIHGSYSREDMFCPTSAEDYMILFEKYIHVFACIDAIARNLAKLPFRIYQLKRQSATKDRRGEEVTDGPIWSLFNQPNKFSSGYNLIYSMVAFLKLVGTTYVEKVGKNSAEPVELWVLRPDWMRAIPDPVNLIAGYEYIVDSRTIKYKPEEILRIKTWHPRSELYGLSTISPAQDAIITDLYATTYSKQFFRQGGHINWYLSVKDDELSDGERNRMEQQLKTKFSGLGNAHLPAIFTNGAELKELGGNPDRNTLLPQRTLSREGACEVYGVPVLMLALPNETHYNNADAQYRFFWEQTEQPVGRELEDTINRDILWPLDLEGAFDYSSVDVLQPKVSELANTGKTLIESKQMTPNEVRAKVLVKAYPDLQPVDGGDAFSQPPAPQFPQVQQPFGGQMNKQSSDLGLIIKIIELLMAKGAAGSGHHAHLPAPDGGRGSAPALTEDKLKEIERHLATGAYIDAYDKLRTHGIERDQAKRIVQAAQYNGGFKQVMDEIGIKPKDPKLSQNAKRQAICKAIVAHRDGMKDVVYKDLEPWAVDGYKAYGQAVLGVVDRISKSIAVIKKDVVAEAVASLDPETKKMADALLKLEKGKLQKVIAAEYGRAKKEPIPKAEMDRLAAKSEEWLNKSVDETMGHVSDTAKNRVQDKLTSLLESDASTADITKEFQDLFEGTDRAGSAWARNIARTEALKFTETSRFNTLSSMDFADKEWFHSGHDNPRPDHLAADGEVVPMNEKFSTGLLYPGDSENGGPEDNCNCGCTFAESVAAAVEEG
jgi:HK97 family phage portal protein